MLQVPRPGGRVRFESKQPLLGQRGEELDREERITLCPFVYELCKRVGMRALTMQRVGEELGDVGHRQRRESDLAHHDLSSPDGIQGLRQGVRGADLVIAKRPDEEEVTDVRVRDEVLD